MRISDWSSDVCSSDLVGAVGALRTRHRADAADMRFAAELGGQVGLVGAAHASAGRVAALRHEAVDDAVEDDAVVKLLPGVHPDPLATLGGEGGAHAGDAVAAPTQGEAEGGHFVCATH